MKLFKLLFWPIILTLGYLILISYPYFFSKINRFDSLGGLSVVDERNMITQKTIGPSHITDQFDNHLLKGEKIRAEFKSSENNFGILLVKFIQLSAKVSDTVVFRIKEQGDNNWYYENEYKANQFQPNEYFTFGFPPIANSKDKTYVFEVQSQAGTYKNGIGLSPKKPQVALVYKYSRDDLKEYKTLQSFIFKKFYYVARNIDFLQNWQLLATLILPMFLVLFIMKEKQVKIARITRFFLMQLKIPLLVTIVFFLIQAFISFNRFGILSIIEETVLDFKTDKQEIQLLEGQKVSATFKATENNLGILLVKLIKFGMGSDQVVFRIKREAEKKWYHESVFLGSQIKNDEYFPLGFPPIANSKNSVYVFEIEPLTGSYTHGIGVINDRQGSLMYKYSAGDLKNYKTLLTFVFKKIIYTIKDVNYWQVSTFFALSLLATLLVKKLNLRLLTFMRLFPQFRINLQHVFKTNINKIKLGLHFLEKSLDGFLNKMDYWFTSSKVYLPFLDTNTKKRLAVGILIFLFAFIYRYSSGLVNPDSFFYYGLGGQGDYDQFIRASTCSVTSFCSWILTQNLLVESLILGTFYQLFGFIGGIKAYLYLMLIASSVVATFPYILLSRKTWFSLGGIIGSLFMATSDFLTRVALNYPPDNGSTFLFSILFIVYFLTIYKGTIRWLLLFGLSGFIDGMFKALFLINDIVALGLFAPIFFYENTIKKSKPLFKKKNIKIAFLSLIPILVFLGLYSSWEFLVEIKFSAVYFLRGLIESKGSSFVAYTSFREGSSAQSIEVQILFLSVSTIVMMKHLIEYADFQIVLLSPFYLGLLFVSFAKPKFPVKKFVATFILSVILIILLTLIKSNYFKIHELFSGEYIAQNWTNLTYVKIFLFGQIIILFLANFGYYALKLSLPILPYTIMLIFLTKNSPFPRISTQIVVWNVILFAFLVDWILMNVNRYARKRMKIMLRSALLILLVGYYFLPKAIATTIQLNLGLLANKNEAEYLKWVNSEIPPNAVILAGGKSDLISLGEYISKPFAYNTLWSTAVLVKPNKIPGVTPTDFSLISELQNRENFKKKKYVILENDIYIWRNRVTGVTDSVFFTSASTLHAENYSLKVYKYNPALKKAIYELNFKGINNF